MIKLPGLIDPHVHLRDPGQTQKEDFRTGTMAALYGGFTTVLDMPNNAVPITTAKRLAEKIKLAKKKAVVDIGFYFGSLGDNFDQFPLVYDKVYGLKLYLNQTTGNYLIGEKELLAIYEHWRSEKPILIHGEEEMLATVFSIVKKTGRRTHICHVSSKNELRQIINAKEDGLPVTCGVTPHHLFLCDKDVVRLGSFAFVKPPIKTDADRRFLWKNLKMIDVVESDHAPHTVAEKESASPPFGLPGLETTLALLLTAVSERRLTIDDIVRLCHDNPAKIFSVPINKNTYILIDEKERYTIENKNLHTKCGWTPFAGWKVQGKIKTVVIRGQLKINDHHMKTPFFDPLKTYEENYREGPFGDFRKPKIYKEAGEPQQQFFGYYVYEPFGIPAGPLLNSKYVNAALDTGFDVVVYKTVRSRKYPTNPYPNVVPLSIKGNLTWKMSLTKPVTVAPDYGDPLSITNSFGVPSMAPSTWQPDARKALAHAKKGQLVIVSFEGTNSSDGSLKKYIDDWVLTARLVLETGAKVVEANLSCPNELGTKMLYQDTAKTKRIIFAVKEKIGNLPLLIKLGYFPEKKELKNFVRELAGIVDGFSIINTIPAAIVNPDGSQALPGKNRLRGGVCGAAIRWAGLEMVKELAELKREMAARYAIVGVGGVVKPADYFEYRKAGADCVMSATGAMWNPFLAQEIKKQT